MKQVIKYVADNGKEFNTEEECKAFEESLTKVDNAIHTIMNFCSYMDCDDCRFSGKGECELTSNHPNYWGHLLKKGF